MNKESGRTHLIFIKYARVLQNSQVPFEWVRVTSTKTYLFLYNRTRRCYGRRSQTGNLWESSTRLKQCTVVFLAQLLTKEVEEVADLLFDRG